MDANPDALLRVDEDVDVVIAAPDCAELPASLIAQVVSIAPDVRDDMPRVIQEKRVVDRRVVRVVLAPDSEAEVGLQELGEFVEYGVADDARRIVRAIGAR